MKDHAATAGDLPVVNAARTADSDSARQHLRRALIQRRGVLLICACVATGILIPLAMFESMTPLIDRVDAIVLFGFGLVFGVGCLALLLVSERQLVAVQWVWALASVAGLAALIINALFGTHRLQLLQDQVPIVALLVPIQVCVLFTLVPRVWVGRLSVAIAAFSALLLLIFVIQNISQLASPAASLVMFGALTIMPLVGAQLMMLQVDRASGFARDAAYGEALLDLEQARRREAGLRDRVTTGLNSVGVRQSLREHLHQQAETWLLLVQFRDFESLTWDRGTEGVDRLLRHLAVELSDAMGPQTHWGRMRRHEFILWSSDLGGESFDDVVDSIAERLSQLNLPESSRVEFDLGRARAGRAQPGNIHDPGSLLIEEAQIDLLRNLPEPSPMALRRQQRKA